MWKTLATKKGTTKACPDCKYTLVKYVDLPGAIGSWRTKCPNCGNKYIIGISQKTIITVTRVTVLTFMFFFLTKLGIEYTKEVEAHREQRICADFPTWEDAYNAFMADPVKYKGMDRDHDGIPCENRAPKDVESR